MDLSCGERVQQPFIVFNARFATDTGATAGSDLDPKTASWPRFFQPQEGQTKAMSTGQFAQFLLSCMLGGKQAEDVL